MQENRNDQPIELTYPIEIQFTDPNETNDSNQPMEQDSDREPAVKVAFVSSCFHSMSLTQVT